MPNVSVIVTTYNRKEYLTETVQSILNQTYQDFELIVIDNYSNYDFFALIKSFNCEKIIAFQNQNNGIIAVNRNFGIKHANGNFITFCDDDDLWHKRKIEQQLIYMNSNSSAVLISTLAKKFGKTTNFFSKNYGIMYRNIDLDFESLITKNPIILSSIMVRKECVLKVGGFSELKELNTIEDLDLYVKLFDQGELYIIQKVLVFYRFHDNNSNNNKFEKLNNYLKRKNFDHTVLKREMNNSPFYLIIGKNSLHLLIQIWYLFIGIISKHNKLNQIILKGSKKK